MNACRIRLIAIFSIPAILFTALIIGMIATVIVSGGNPAAVAALAFMAFVVGIASLDLLRRFITRWRACGAMNVAA